MNVTIRQAISQLKVPSKGVNADSRLTNKYLYSLLSKHRDWLVRETQGKFRLFSLNYLFQPYRCAELVPVSTVDDCCGVKLNCARGHCTIYRTKKKLPELMLSSDGPIIRRVTSIDKGVDIFEITPMEWNRKQEDTNAKYDKTLYYFWDNGYLYFPNLHWRRVYIEAFFAKKVVNECDGSEQECVRFLDQPFMIPQDLLGRCVEAAQKELLGFYHQIPSEEQIDKNENRKS